MTVNIKLECDGLNCNSEREIELDNDSAIERAGWNIDYLTGFHYCPKCWVVVKEELERDKGI